MDYILLLNCYLHTLVAQIFPVLLFRSSIKLITLSFKHACSVMSDCLWPHGLQRARPPCPSLSPAVCSNSSSLCWWCHPNISPSVIPFSYPQSFLASRSFPMSSLFASDGQSIGSSASILPMNIHGWFPLGLTVFVSLVSKELSIVFSSTTVLTHQFFGTQPSLWSNSHTRTWLLKSYIHHIVLSQSSVNRQSHCFHSGLL